VLFDEGAGGLAEGAAALAAGGLVAQEGQDGFGEVVRMVGDEEVLAIAYGDALDAERGADDWPGAGHCLEHFEAGAAANSHGGEVDGGAVNVGHDVVDCAGDFDVGKDAQFVESGMGRHAGDQEAGGGCAANAGQHFFAEPYHGIDVGAVVHFSREDERRGIFRGGRLGQVAGDFDAVGHVNSWLIRRERGQRLPVGFADGDDAGNGAAEGSFVADQFVPLEEAIAGGVPAIWVAGVHEGGPFLQQEFGVVIVEDNEWGGGGRLQNLEAVGGHLDAFDLHEIVVFFGQNLLQFGVGLFVVKAEGHIGPGREQGVAQAAFERAVGLPECLYAGAQA